MSKTQYRADIDGLRAIAVLGVIFFHADFGLTGGFVGVDVFFVISGYLISRIIKREIEEGRFSLKDFWVRRIRRILPAAAVVVLATFLVGLLVLEPNSLKELGKSGAAYSVISANIFFYQSSGYFSESAELQPLLHMWSLSVEEQFYIALPIIMVIILRRKPKWCFALMAAAGLASFALNISQLKGQPSAVFYLLPFRAWELLAGTLLALGEARIKLNDKTNEVLAICGLGAIASTMYCYSDATPFPGFAAILPVGGSVLFIAANTRKVTYAGKLVSGKFMVAIGLMSYSLYLWHWPILAFCRHMFIEQSQLVIGVALTLTLLSSYLSWRYVETPFRVSRRLKNPATAFRFGAAVTLAVGLIAIVFWFRQGLPNRFNEPTRVILKDISRAGAAFLADDPPGISLGHTDEQAANSPPDFVLWGDSHAMPVVELIDQLAKERRLRGNALISPGRAPVTGLWKPLQGADRETETPVMNQSRLDWIIDSGVKHVVLVARWKAMIDGYRDTEIDERIGRIRNCPMVVDSPETTPNAEASQKALRQQLTKMIKRLADHDVSVWLVLQAPVASRTSVARDFYLTKRFPSFNQESFQLDTPKSEYLENRSTIVNLLTGIESENLHCVDPLSFVYGDEDSLRLYGERAFYRDEDHLTRAGAEHFLRPMYSEILEKIKQQ